MVNEMLSGVGVAFVAIFVGAILLKIAISKFF